MTTRKTSETPGHGVTLKDVARATKFHHTTVSMALRGSTLLADKTRTSIVEAAQRMGYRRDPVHQALTARRIAKKAKRPLIAFVTNRPTLEEFNQGRHMQDFLAGARERAHALGYDCKLVLIGESRLTDGEIDAQLLAHGTQGIILGAFMPHWRDLTLNWSSYAVARIDSGHLSPRVPIVSNHSMQSIRLALGRLHALGYRRIGVALGSHDDENYNHRLSASARMECLRLGIPGLALFDFQIGEDPVTTTARIRRWLQEERPDAVLANFSQIEQLLEKAGYPAPSALAAACLCLSSDTPASTAGILQDHFTIGQRAAESVALSIRMRLSGERKAPEATFVDSRWQDGASAPVVKS